MNRYFSVLAILLLCLYSSEVWAQPFNIIWYDDYEESEYAGSIREYLEGEGHTVDYNHDGASLDLTDATYDDFDVVVAEHTCGTGTLLGLEEWFTSGRGYVALINGSMYNDPEDSYIMTLFDVDRNGCPNDSPFLCSRDWNIADLVWVDDTHSIANIPNSGFLASEFMPDQNLCHVDLPDGIPVIESSVNDAVALVVAENVLGSGSGNTAFLGTNFHSSTRSDPETRSLVENMIYYVVFGGDSDEDGFTTGDGDCDDHNNTIYPGAEELCDGLDNNCDGERDEGLERTTFWPDTDEDTFGDETLPTLACLIPPGFVENGEDCNDQCDTCHPGGVEYCDDRDNDCDREIDNDVVYQDLYRDSDGDGYGVTGTWDYTCYERDGWVTLPGDCNDANASVNPGAIEACDRVDNDCNGEIDDGLTVYIFVDNDGDGYGNAPSGRPDCEIPEGYVGIGGDCNDRDEEIHPKATEVCDNQDNNCDEEIDEGLLSIFYVDLDGDSYGDPDASIEACELEEGYADNSDDCDDTDAEVNPDIEEVVGDGIDNDCDEQIDEVDAADGDGDADSDGDVDGDADGDLDGDVVEDGDAETVIDPSIDTPRSEDGCSCSTADTSTSNIAKVLSDLLFFL